MNTKRRPWRQTTTQDFSYLLATELGGGPSVETAGLARATAELARRLETAKLSRDIRRRSWKGLGAEELTLGSEAVELARGSETASWPELRGGRDGQSSEMVELVNQNMTRRNRYRDGGDGQGSERTGWPRLGAGAGWTLGSQITPKTFYAAWTMVAVLYLNWRKRNGIFIRILPVFHPGLLYCPLNFDFIWSNYLSQLRN